jgi:hypothetical protein
MSDPSADRPFALSAGAVAPGPQAGGIARVGSDAVETVPGAAPVLSGFVDDPQPTASADEPITESVEESGERDPEGSAGAGPKLIIEDRTGLRLPPGWDAARRAELARRDHRRSLYLPLVGLGLLAVAVQIGVFAPGLGTLLGLSVIAATARIWWIHRLRREAGLPLLSPLDQLAEGASGAAEAGFAILSMIVPIGLGLLGLATAFSGLTWLPALPILALILIGGGGGLVALAVTLGRPMLPGTIERWQRSAAAVALRVDPDDPLSRTPAPPPPPRRLPGEPQPIPEPEERSSEGRSPPPARAVRTASFPTRRPLRGGPFGFQPKPGRGD